MKKYTILSLALLSLLFSLGSCSSDENLPEMQVTDNTRQAVTINIENIVNEFTTTTKSIKTAAPDSCYLWYAIYRKSDGVLLLQRQLAKSDVLAIQDSLLQGDYIYSVFASDRDLRNLTTYGNFQNYYLNNLYVMLSNQDMFQKTFEVSVNKTSVNVPVTLKRIVSKLTINVEDPQFIPQDIRTVVLSVSSLPVKYNLRTGFTDIAMPGTGHTETEIYTDYREDLLALGSNQYVLYLLPNLSPYYEGNQQLDISIKLYSSNDEIGLVKTFIIKKDLKIDKNKSITLTGKLYPDKTNNISDITINADWKAITEQPFDNN